MFLPQRWRNSRGRAHKLVRVPVALGLPLRGVGDSRAQIPWCLEVTYCGLEVLVEARPDILPKGVSFFERCTREDFACILEVIAIAVIDLNSPAFTSVLWVFLLFILGSCFLMTDRSCVKTSFLPLMDPIDRFDTFDWGGAIYASILAGLRRVSHRGGRSVRFFYHFHEMWAHEYLDPFCPSLKISDITSFPRSSRWSAPSSKVDSHLLEKAREELDCLTLRRISQYLALLTTVVLYPP
ncbi:hypothetical protein HHK36_021059 [Tetracentron sinense]|uniref:Aminotransferase-like plant mobile domain-containing protein n=1 Tax=Tetracentron sinense TaxID=13715 RepID=A0A835D9J7_TETSI|nr:hypothetical protein HHK36_021059 [Tetracentron sinense]